MVADDPFVVYPAVDIRQGRCVRLVRGEPNSERVFGEPVAMARHWAEQGAEALHVVDLDGAFAGHPEQLGLLANITASVSIPVQFGGGLRREEDIEAAFGAGAARVVVGTAVQDRTFFRRLIERWGARRIVAGLDARGRQLAVQGWTRTGEQDVIAVAEGLREAGATHALYTQVEQDGTMGGPDLDGIARMLTTGLRVIASGGVRGVDDVAALARLSPRGLCGVVVGRALYDGALDLGSALVAGGGASNAHKADHRVSGH